MELYNEMLQKYLFISAKKKEFFREERKMRNE